MQDFFSNSEQHLPGAAQERWESAEKIPDWMIWDFGRFMQHLQQAEAEAGITWPAHMHAYCPVKRGKRKP